MEKDNRDMLNVRPAYVVALFIAIVLYVVYSCIMHSDLCYRLCVAEHKLLHLTGEHQGSCPK
jgi:hypothetical protein